MVVEVVVVVVVVVVMAGGVMRTGGSGRFNSKTNLWLNLESIQSCHKELLARLTSSQYPML